MVMILVNMPFTKSPIIETHEVKAIVGKIAKGSCKLMIVFRISFIPVKSLI